MLTLVDDHGLVINAILWLLFCISVIIICCALIQLVQLCFICHRLCSNTVYRPVYKAYKIYQDYMQIEPLPVLNV
ncbi:envelope protein [Bat coronavirus 1B]|uniref:Envelope small membrane protein n=4 Tax=Orthocoronavirinae TaxID=2501931 RepID=B1PHJ0_9ALPC|nr:envelope protein [Bat coronavirus 1B]WCC61959.1 envelope protein [Bat Coronavirus MpGD16]WCC62007.1 envelope protein [Bat Coronavirus MpGD17]WCC63111.1 envelope protein [Bat Coronavirus MpYN20]WCC61971.1 envelope protein [Bat Coronavirus MpGD16]